MKDVHLPQHIKDFFKNEKVTQNEKAEMAFKLWSKKADIWKAISDYIYPKRRAVEVKGDIGKAPIFNITIPAVGDPSITQQDSTAATGIPIPEGLGSSSTGAKGPTKH